MRLFYDRCGITGFGIIAILCAAVSGLIAIGVGLDATACIQYGAMSGREIAYRFPSGCFVKNDGKFVTVDEFKARAITNERGRE